MKIRISPAQFIRCSALTLSALALPAVTFAQGLPTLENPSRGTGNGIMET
ncbi:TIGR03745 family integrating conjugative element membrane protein, partial [Pseudomonas aeruginosa]